MCTQIQANTFQDCITLMDVSAPACTTIQGNAFAQCSALVGVYFPECTSVYGSAFLNCYALSMISLPKCTTISAYAFSGCSALSNLYLLGSSVVNLANINAFTNTPLTVEGFGTVYVPSSLYSDYMASTNWSLIANRFSSV